MQKYYWRRLSVTGLCLMFCPHQGLSQLAQELDPLSLSLDSLLDLKVETVSRRAESIEVTPGSVYVFTADIIRKRGYTSLTDLLTHVPGFNIFHGGLQFSAVVRGLASNDNEKFTLLINGVEVNQVNEPDLLNGPINLENAERVEIVVGPSSLFEQANTLVATINVITKKMDGVEAIVSAGNERKEAVTINAGKQFSPDRSISLSASIEERYGWDAWDTKRSPSPISRNAGEDSTGATTALDYFILGALETENVKGQWISRRRSFPELRLYDSTNSIPVLNPEYIDEMHGGSVRVEQELPDCQMVFAELSSFYKKSTRSTDSFTWQSVAQWDHGAELGYTATVSDHYVQLGLQATYEDNFDCLFNEGGANQETFFDENTYGLGTYLSDTFKVTDRLTLFSGLRADQNTLVGHDFHWGGRLGSSYKVSDTWTTKLFVNRAIRMPSPLGALNEIWGINAINPPTWANRSTTVDHPEVLTTFEWGNTFHYSRGHIVATLYYQELSDYISWGAPHTNVGDYSGWGVECSNEHWLSAQLKSWSNASFIQSKFDPNANFGDFIGTGQGHAVMDNEDRLLGAPIFTANTGLDWAVMKQIYFSPSITYFTEQPIKKTTGEFSTVNNRFYINATLLFDQLFGTEIDVRISAKNILNNRKFIGSTWQEGEYRPRGASYEISARVAF